MSRGPDVATLIERALLHSARAAGCAAAMEESAWERWASVTFTGARHHLSLSLSPAGAAKHWLAALPEMEFSIRGHLVADLVVERVADRSDGCTASIEILSVEDR